MNYEYKGYRYSLDPIDDEGWSRFWHEVITPEGKVISMEWNTAGIPSEETFQFWVDNGMPRPAPGYSFQNLNEIKEAIKMGSRFW